MKDNVKISVLMITYNHEAYISQAIESVVNQQTTYDIELIIGEDCSTDSTRKICKEYANKFPNIIKVLPNKNNLGIRKNFLRTLKECKGDYVAYLEGDDYWTDNSKIQMQVDYLQANKECMICCHRAKILSEETGKYTELDDSNIVIDADIKVLCSTNYIYANSVVFRHNRDYIKKFELDTSVADWVLWVFLAQYGYIHYINKTMSVYREHGAGVFSKKEKIEKIVMSMKAADNWHRLIGDKCEEEYSMITGACAFEIITEELKKENCDRTILSENFEVVSKSLLKSGYLINSLKSLVTQKTEENIIVKNSLQKLMVRTRLKIRSML